MATQTTHPAETQPAAEPTRPGQHYRPVVDIVEHGDELLIVADMPGVTADGIDIHFEDGQLTIHGQVRPRREVQQRYFLEEYGVGDFYRVFQISQQIDPARITADYAEGVLTVHLPKAEAARPRKIAVQAR